MLNHYDFQIKAMNTAIRMTLRSQCVQPESSFYGAVEWLDKAIPVRTARSAWQGK